MKKIILIIAALFLLVFAGCTSGNTTEAVNGLYTNAKGDVFCIIYDGMITVSQKSASSAVSASSVVSEVFTFTLDNGAYNGENVENTISFRLNEDKLSLNMSGKTYSLTLDKSFQFEGEAVKLNKPGDIKVDLSQIFWNMQEFNNPYENGILKACIEVTSEEYEPIDVEYIDYIPEPAAMFLYDLKNMKLAQGEYNLSIRYIGGCYLKGGVICRSSDSEAVIFSVTVTQDNEYIISLKD